MRKLTIFLEQSKNQRIINGFISIILIVWILVKLRYVYLASDIEVHYKYYLLKMITLIYLIQTFKNKIWLNWMTKGIFMILILYVLYTYCCSFFDQDDYLMRKEYGVFLKSWGTFVKISILLLMLWFTDKIRPKMLKTAVN